MDTLSTEPGQPLSQPSKPPSWPRRIIGGIFYAPIVAVKLAAAVAVVSLFSFFGKYTPDAFKKIADYWNTRVHKRVKQVLFPITWTIGKAVSLPLRGLYWMHHAIEHVATQHWPGKNYFAALGRHKTAEGVFFSTFFPGVLAGLVVGAVDLGMTLTTGVGIPWWLGLAIVKYTGGTIAFKGWIENRTLIRSNHTLRMVDDYSQAAIDGTYAFAVNFINDFSLGALKGCEQLIRQVRKYNTWWARPALNVITHPFKKMFGHSAAAKVPEPYPAQEDNDARSAPLSFDVVRNRASAFAKRVRGDVGQVIDVPNLTRAPVITLAKAVLRDGVENIFTKAIPDMFEAFRVEKAPLLGGAFKWSVYGIASLVSFGVNRVLIPIITVAAPVVDNTYHVAQHVATSPNPKVTVRKYVRYAGRSVRRVAKHSMRRVSPGKIRRAVFGSAAGECVDKVNVERRRLCFFLPHRPQTAAPDAPLPKRAAE